MSVNNLAVVILNASSGKEAVQQCFAYRKAIDPKFSLAYLARKLSFKSRGTLSQMIRGKRAIPARIRRQFLEVLIGEETLIEYVELMLDLAEEQSSRQKANIEVRLKGIAFYLRDRFTRMKIQHSLTLFASDVLCAFGLFNGEPTERQLVDFFGKHRYQEVRSAIRILTLNKLVERKNNKLYRTEQTKRFLTFNDPDQDDILTYIKESIYDAHQMAGVWKPNPDLACFGSTTMSVKKAEYIKILAKLRKDVFQYFSDLETDEGDTLIRFNMQVYPLQSPQQPK